MLIEAVQFAIINELHREFIEDVKTNKLHLLEKISMKSYFCDSLFDFFRYWK